MFHCRLAISHQHQYHFLNYNFKMLFANLSKIGFYIYMFALPTFDRDAVKLRNFFAFFLLFCKKSQTNYSHNSIFISACCKSPKLKCNENQTDHSTDVMFFFSKQTLDFCLKEFIFQFTKT